MVYSDNVVMVSHAVSSEQNYALAAYMRTANTCHHSYRTFQMEPKVTSEKVQPTKPPTSE